jgi:hypothetical protein
MGERARRFQLDKSSAHAKVVYPSPMGGLSDEAQEAILSKLEQIASGQS